MNRITNPKIVKGKWVKFRKVSEIGVNIGPEMALVEVTSINPHENERAASPEECATIAEAIAAIPQMLDLLRAFADHFDAPGLTSDSAAAKAKRLAAKFRNI
jgi:hypothetical protein